MPFGTWGLCACDDSDRVTQCGLYGRYRMVSFALLVIENHFLSSEMGLRFCGLNEHIQRRIDGLCNIRVQTNLMKSCQSVGQPIGDWSSSGNVPSEWFCYTTDLVWYKGIWVGWWYSTIYNLLSIVDKLRVQSVRVSKSQVFYLVFSWWMGFKMQYK